MCISHPHPAPPVHSRSKRRQQARTRSLQLQWRPAGEQAAANYQGQTSSTRALCSVPWQSMPAMRQRPPLVQVRAPRLRWDVQHRLTLKDRGQVTPTLMTSALPTPVTAGGLSPPASGCVCLAMCQWHTRLCTAGGLKQLGGTSALCATISGACFVHTPVSDHQIRSTQALLPCRRRQRHAVCQAWGLRRSGGCSGLVL